MFSASQSQNQTANSIEGNIFGAKLYKDKDIGDAKKEDKSIFDKMMRSMTKSGKKYLTPAASRSPLVMQEIRDRFVHTSTLVESDFATFGKHLFKGAVAAPYLEKHGLPRDFLENPGWVRTDKTDNVANAVLDWARDNGASSYCHWSQPMGSALLRHGQTATVQNTFFEFDAQGNLIWNFKGKHLLKSETDGSSYMNGGLRSTHSAAAYIVIDATSPIFLREDTVFIPGALVTYSGLALDEKTPLLKATTALSDQGTRLLKLLGVNTDRLTVNIGLEQEFFFIPRDLYHARPDLKYTGRTLIGRAPARGQELCDHYMSPPSLASAALACMQEIQHECFKLGIPLRTRHREVAPNQYEFAPMYGFVTTQIDQNLMVMQIIEEVSVRHNLAALFHEKPFQGVNGSGKHNNWSISLGNGANLFNFDEITQATGNPDVFPTILACMVWAIDKYGDLMRLATACPGNDFRLGACEAPPAITSVYLGSDVTDYLQKIRVCSDEAAVEPYAPNKTALELGVGCLPLIDLPAEDRNRTSSFPFGGHRFEFRSVGASQNVSIVNTVLNSITAIAFKHFADEIENGKTPRRVAKEALSSSWKVIFNGDGYDPANQEKLTKDGLWRFDSGVEAVKQFTAEKNVAMFEELKIFTPTECLARQRVMLKQYAGIVEMEAQVLVDMINTQILPAVHLYTAHIKEEDAVSALRQLVGEVGRGVEQLVDALHHLHSTADLVHRAELCRELRLGLMMEVRTVVDRLEGQVPEQVWPLPTYGDLLFLDQNTEGPSR